MCLMLAALALSVSGTHSLKSCEATLQSPIALQTYQLVRNPSRPYADLVATIYRTLGTLYHRTLI
jgi:hypothetical protein